MDIRDRADGIMVRLGPLRRGTVPIPVLLTVLLTGGVGAVRVQKPPPETLWPGPMGMKGPLPGLAGPTNKAPLLVPVRMAGLGTIGQVPGRLPVPVLGPGRGIPPPPFRVVPEPVGAIPAMAVIAAADLRNPLPDPPPPGPIIPTFPSQADLPGKTARQTPEGLPPVVLRTGLPGRPGPELEEPL